MESQPASGDMVLPLGPMGRRRALTLFGAGLVALAGCGSSDDDTAATTSAGGSSSPSGASSSSTAAAGGASTTAATTGETTAACEEIPDETGGPFPGDGSNGPDVLSQEGVVRQDIRSSIGSATGTAEGVPLTVKLTLVDAADGCAPLAGGAVYLWHCDRAGLYSMYSEGAADENYLRGVQAADADGRLSFTSIFPAAYSGRWPHIHFEVYATEADATGGGSLLKTSQLALPEDVCDVVYATEGYEQSVTNMASLSIETDGIFSDGHDLQLATVTGNVDDGFVAELIVAV